MRRSILVALALLFLLMAVGLAAAAKPAPAAPATPAVCTPAQIMEEFGKAVVLIEGQEQKDATKTWQGSGFLVSSDGRIVTNYHVIKGLYPAFVKLASGDKYDDISIIAYDARKDLAVIKIRGFNLPTVRFGNSDDVKLGDRLVVIGNPKGLENTISDGLLSGVRTMEQGFRNFQLSAPVSHGSSGGPVFNLKGEVVGVIDWGFEEGQNLNFAIPGNYVRGMIEGKVKYELKNLPEEEVGIEENATPSGQTEEKATAKEGLKLLIEGMTQAFFAMDLADQGRGKCEFEQNITLPNSRKHEYRDAVIDPQMYEAQELLERAKKAVAAAATVGGSVGDLAEAGFEDVSHLLEAQKKIIGVFLKPKKTRSEAALNGYNVSYAFARADLLNLSSDFQDVCKEVAPDLAASLPPGLQQGPPLTAGQGTLGCIFPSSADTLRVVLVARDGPAEKGGLHENDVILGVEGGPTFAHQKECDAFIRAHPKEQIHLTIRRDERERTVTVVPEAYKPEP